MNDSKVILVMLRQPKRNKPNEMRTDPLWEFGSFGCTGCHRTNVMNPKRLAELKGVRIAFAQNGPLGVKLVHVTPPVTTHHHGRIGELKWSPVAMPLTYESAPVLVSNSLDSAIPSLLDVIDDVDRTSPVARFSSAFRSRRTPLPSAVGNQLVRLYERFRQKSGILSRSYVDALPYPPPRIDTDREATYGELRGDIPLSRTGKTAGGPRARRC